MGTNTLADQAGIEPATHRLRVDCSTSELLVHIWSAWQDLNLRSQPSKGCGDGQTPLHTVKFKFVSSCPIFIATLETTYSAIGLKYQSLVALMHREQLPVRPIKNPGFNTGVLVNY